jgi:hypothetical protein
MHDQACLYFDRTLGGDVTYELVLAVVPADSPDPVDHACQLLEPFLHTDDCQHDPDEQHVREKLRTAGHFWDGACVGHGHHFTGRLWLDRYGKLPPDHPINRPEDEIRRAGDVDLRALMLLPCALVTPDGLLYLPGGEPHSMFNSRADHAELEDRLAEYPDHLAVPVACHS